MKSAIFFRNKRPNEKVEESPGGHAWLDNRAGWNLRLHHEIWRWFHPTVWPVRSLWLAPINSVCRAASADSIPELDPDSRGFSVRSLLLRTRPHSPISLTSPLQTARLSPSSLSASNMPLCVWHSLNFYAEECKHQIRTRLAEELRGSGASSVCYVT